MAIPLPQRGSRSLMQGVGQGANLMQQMMQNQRANQELAMKQEMQPYQQELAQSQAQLAANKANIMQSLLSGQGVSATGEYTPQQLALAKMVGIDLTQETPSQKRDREFQLFKDKEAFKQNADKNLLTSSSQTGLQQEITGIEKLMPELDALIGMTPHSFGLGAPSSKEYDAQLFRLADGLVKALNLPQTNASIKEMKDSLRLGYLETEVPYKARLERLKKDLIERSRKNMDTLSKGGVGGSSGMLTYNPETGDFE